MPIETRNPATGAVVKTFVEMSDGDADAIVRAVHERYTTWHTVSVPERAKRLVALAAILERDKESLGKLATLEMGKPITSAIAEIEKCAWACQYYADNAEAFLKPEEIKTDATYSAVQFEPLGVILGIMPWNFPFWQAIRFIAPAVVAGNTVVLKHASNVPQCALMIEHLFTEAGFPADTVRTVLVSSDHIQNVITHPRVAAVSLTGSTPAGMFVAAAAGTALKKTVLELGGSDPFMVLDDADIHPAAEAALQSRMLNNGQSCIAAKRFIVMAERYEEFIERLRHEVKHLRVGDPMLTTTTLGPLAREDLRDTLHAQVQGTIAKGGRLITGGRAMPGEGYYYMPTVIADVTKGMPLFDEEVFGPVAAVIKADSEDEVVSLANDSPFGLGASIWTHDSARGKRLAARINAGAVFINGIVKSDPRLPFGGIKHSGYGRELSRHGMLEFVNKKTVWVR